MHPIARADAFQLRDKIRSVAIPEHLYTPSKIGIAILSTSQNLDNAMIFFNYISAPQRVKLFTDAGFLPYGHNE